MVLVLKRFSFPSIFYISIKFKEGEFHYSKFLFAKFSLLKEIIEQELSLFTKFTPTLEID